VRLNRPLKAGQGRNGNATEQLVTTAMSGKAASVERRIALNFQVSQMVVKILTIRTP
jgi:hypothetical protein